MSTLRQYPLGDTITGSPHSVVCSLPTMAAVRGYEEKDPDVLARLSTGYPRFVQHPFVAQTAALLAHRAQWSGEPPLLAAEAGSAQKAVAFAGGGEWRIQEGLAALYLPAGETREKARLFLQHTGGALSSREAEDWLAAQGKRCSVFSEKYCQGDSADHIRRHLHSLYGTLSLNHIFLCRGGMSAFWAAYQATNQVQQKRGRTVWLQLGWLYLDTMRILEKFHPAGAPPIQIYNVFDLAAVEQVLDAAGSRVAGIVAEIPTNPLVQTCDLPRLRELADRSGAALLLDPTIASPRNVNILPYCDLHINSLTKYAGHEGDVMLGAVAVNGRSPLAAELLSSLPSFLEAPYYRDLGRLAAQIDRYESTVQTINQNTARVVEFLLGHPRVHRVWWAGHPASGANYRRLQTADGGWGSIVTFSVKMDLPQFYDRARLAKGPSFGLDYSLMCPFLYLAHYDLVNDPAGRRLLQSHGLDPELIRFSVGTEPAEEIIEVLAEALS